MTFAWTPFVGLGISVEDIYFADEPDDENPEKHIWILFHLPFFRLGIIL